MYISCIGIDYNLADIELRGAVAFTESGYREIYRDILNINGVCGSIIISTCNRTEIYVHSQNETCGSLVLFHIGRYFSLTKQQLDKFFILASDEAVKRIFRVASGIESMILGEDQILGQVKNAHAKALEYKASSSVLNRLFREAVTCAKEVRHKTSISQNKLSIASIAVEIISKHYGDINRKSALIIGAGDMSRLTIQGLYNKGIGQIFLINRTKDNCSQLLEEFPKLVIVSFDGRYKLLKDIDILVSSTAAPHTVLDYDSFKEHYCNKDILVLDLAVPRDIDPNIDKLNNISLYNIDYFRGIAAGNAMVRQSLLTQVEDIIGEYTDEMKEWLRDSDFHNLLYTVDRYVDDYGERQAEGLWQKHDYDEAISKEEAKALALGVSGRLLKQMILKVKSLEEADVQLYLGVLKDLLC